MINLLPPSYRSKVAEEQRVRLILVFAVMFGTALAALSIFLVVIQVSLARERMAQESKLASFLERSAKEDSTLSEIKSWNSKLRNIKAFKADRRSVKEVFDKLSLSLPQDLFLLSLSYTPSVETKKKNEEVSKTPAVISVTGYAPTREQLLSFKDTLQADPFFAETVFPPSNWVEPTNITFSFQAKLKN